MIFFILTYLKIWNLRIQELFTEIKKLAVLKFGDVAKLARIAKYHNFAICIGFPILKNRVNLGYWEHLEVSKLAQGQILWVF